MKPPFAVVFSKLAKVYPHHAFVEVNGNDPFRILISCILSLRTQDSVSLPATRRLFAAYANVQELSRAKPAQIAKCIYPVGFYRTKAASIALICHQLIDKYDGKVPSNMEALLSFKGVGRKTANLVLSLGFGIPAICVDVHVHRICNRLGWIASKTPEQSELQLMQVVPRKFWIPINSLMVNHGQQCCRPRNPRCKQCPIQRYCQMGAKTPAAEPRAV